MNNKQAWLVRDIVALLIISTVFLLILFPSYTKVSTSRATVNVLSLDEWAFMDFMESTVFFRYKQLDLKVFFIRDNWGYGSLYYIIYGLLAFPAYLIGNFQLKIISLRIISILFASLVAFVLYKIVRLSSRSWGESILTGLALMLFPAFHFFYKPFSAEFISLFFLVAGVYFVLKTKLELKGSFYLATFLLGTAVGLKLSNLPSLLPIAIYILVKVGGLKVNILRKIALGGIIFVLGFLIANPYLLTNGGLDHYMTLVEQNLKSNRSAHGYEASNENVYKWYMEVVNNEYVNIWLFSVLVVFLTYGAYVETKTKSDYKVSSKSRSTALILLIR